MRERERENVCVCVWCVCVCVCVSVCEYSPILRWKRKDSVRLGKTKQFWIEAIETATFTFGYEYFCCGVTHGSASEFEYSKILQISVEIEETSL